MEGHEEKVVLPEARSQIALRKLELQWACPLGTVAMTELPWVPSEKNLWIQGGTGEIPWLLPFSHSPVPIGAFYWPNPDRSQLTQDPGKFSLLWCRAGKGKAWICGLTGQAWHISQLTKKKKKNSNPSLSKFHKREWWISLGLRTRTMHDLHKKPNYDTTKITPPNTNMKDVTRKTMTAKWMIMRGKRPYWSGNSWFLV